MPASASTLMTAQLGARGEVRRLLREDALEAEQQRVEHLPLGRRLLATRLYLRQGVVEGAPARGARCEYGDRILVISEEGLAGPGFGPKSVDAAWPPLLPSQSSESA